MGTAGTPANSIVVVRGRNPAKLKLLLNLKDEL